MPARVETEAPVTPEPLAACLQPARTLVVADATQGEAALRPLAALARVMDVTLALTPASPESVALADALGCAVAVPPGAALPAPPVVAAGSALTVAEVRLHRIALPLRDLYVSSMYLTATQARTVVELRTEGGLVGWGESHATATAIAQRLAQGWIGKDLARDALALKRSIGRIGFDNREGRGALSAYAGLELAAWDLRAKAAGVPLRVLLGHQGAPRPLPVACPLPAAVPGAQVSRAELAAHMAETRNAVRVAEMALGFRARHGINAFKYKSAGTGLAWDYAALSALREALGPEARLRFDPNAAYGTEEALRLCRALEQLGLEFYEDPTDGLEGMARLAAHLRTPLATNMCVIAPEHLASAWRRGVALTVLGDVFLWGGLVGLRDMALAARALGHRPAVHSFYETGIVTAANMHLALALGLDDPHPMDCGWPGLAEDIGPAFTLRDGCIHCPEGPGLGFTPDAAQLAKLATAEPILIR